MNAIDDIERFVKEGLPRLSPHIRDWTKEHLIKPRKVSLALNPDGEGNKELWLVTDHTGHKDSSNRVVYDESEQCFGHECTLDTGVEWFMGLYGDFATTIQSL